MDDLNASVNDINSRTHQNKLRIYVVGATIVFLLFVTTYFVLVKDIFANKLDFDKVSAAFAKQGAYNIITSYEILTDKSQSRIYLEADLDLRNALNPGATVKFKYNFEPEEVAVLLENTIYALGPSTNSEWFSKSARGFDFPVDTDILSSCLCITDVNYKGKETLNGETVYKYDLTINEDELATVVKFVAKVSQQTNSVFRAIVEPAMILGFVDDGLHVAQATIWVDENNFVRKALVVEEGSMLTETGKATFMLELNPVSDVMIKRPNL